MNELSGRRCGTVAILGRPNVGKSTLLNAILGQKLAPTTPTPQTTRRQLRGIETRDDVQYIFVDTPGLHFGRGGLQAFMAQQALDAAATVDVQLLVVEAKAPRKGSDTIQLDPRDLKVLQAIEQRIAPECERILVVNKVDRLRDKRALLPVMEEWTKAARFAAIVPVAALKSDGIDALLGEVAALLPFAPFVYPPDALTDATEKEIAAEIVREAAILELQQELPHRLTVVVEDFDESRRTDDSKPLVTIDGLVVVERASQKAIVVGKGGARIGSIGQRARQNLERLLGCQVMLRLFVKVEPNWTQNEHSLRKLGFRA